MAIWAAAIPAVTGLLQTAISAGKADQMKAPSTNPISPEMQTFFDMARRRADEGNSPEEEAAFNQMLARQGTATKNMLQNVGLAGVGSAAANIMGIDAINKFAAQGAENRRQNFGIFGQAAQGMQSARENERQRQWNQYNLESQALGQGIQAGIGNMMGAVNFAQNQANFDKASALYGMGNTGGGNVPSGTGGGMGSLLQYAINEPPVTDTTGGVPFAGAQGFQFPQNSTFNQTYGSW